MRPIFILWHLFQVLEVWFPPKEDDQHNLLCLIPVTLVVSHNFTQPNIPVFCVILEHLNDTIDNNTFTYQLLEPLRRYHRQRIFDVHIMSNMTYQRRPDPTETPLH